MARRSRQHSSYNSSNLHATIVMPTFLAILGSLTLVQPLLWQIIFIIGSLSVIFLINQWLIDLRILRLRRRQLLELSPSEFEQRVALLLEDLGWKNVVIRGGSGDRGVDITAERDGLRYLVQCKRYSKSVGPSYVRDLVGALHIRVPTGPSLSLPVHLRRSRALKPADRRLSCGMIRFCYNG